MTRLPEWIAPTLATLSDRRDLGPEWRYERKLDGIRALAFVQDGRVRLLSRNRLPLSYPAITEALAVQPHAMALDGEAVAFSGGRSGFAVWQQRHKLGRAVRIVYYVFDVMHLDGLDLRPLPLLERRRRLRAALDTGPAVRMTTSRTGDAAALLDDACAREWEGLIAKRLDSPYAGKRTDDWLKLKCSLEQEFVIGGFTDPKGSRVGFGALLLGYHEGGGLRYGGDVGTGFGRELLLELHARLLPLERDTSPFTNLVRRPKDAHFVEPRLVAQVGFSEWTGDGRLRHPRFLGLREDKSPNEVVRERPA